MNRKISKDEFIHPRKHLKEIKLYVYNPKGQLIWTGNSQLIFLDICSQIAQKRLKGYYVINSLKERTKIREDGGTEQLIRDDSKLQKRLSIILGF